MGTHAHRGPNQSRRPVEVPINAELRGRLLRRYKRFLAEIALEEPGSDPVVVHCPDPGSMRGCARPGAQVRCSTSDNPRRKLRHTLEMIRVGRVWVGTHSVLANQLVARALEAQAIPGLRGYAAWRREVRVDGGSRLDFRLDGHRRRNNPAFLEVKSVTLAEGSTARFPDSVTERGRHHLETLVRLRGQGARAVLLFVVQRSDCDSVEPADDFDPAFGRTLRAAARAGVEVLAVGARVSARAIELRGPLPVYL